jgi:hypothetical protein
MSINFYCVATKSDGYFPVLLESAQRNNINLKVLGMGMKWLGFAWKWKLVYNEIKDLDDEQMIAVIDAYDVIFLKSADYMLNKIYELGIQDKLIVGQDQESLSYQFYFGYCDKHGPVNAGTIIAKKKHILEYVNSMCGEHMNCRNSIDDQYELVQYCNKHPTKVYADHAFDLFVIYLRRNEHVVLNSNAAILHAPVNGNMDHLLKHYGYNFTNTRKRSWLLDKLHWASQPHIMMIIIAIVIFAIFVMVIFIKMSSRILNVHQTKNSIQQKRTIR